jgi:hypothetical protein
MKIFCIKYNEMGNPQVHSYNSLNESLNDENYGMVLRDYVGVGGQ